MEQVHNGLSALRKDIDKRINSILVDLYELKRRVEKLERTVTRSWSGQSRQRSH